MRILKPERPRPLFSAFRESWRDRWSFSVKAGISRLGPYLWLRAGRWVWGFRTDHARDCDCDDCIPF
jgi:hypothetical protein